NMLDPSGEIQDDYLMTVVTTRDGRTHAGNIASETDRQITMRVAGQDNVTLNKSEIQSQETMPVSMMPEGLLQTLSDQEVIDLVAFLRTQEDVEI
ncbi:MAG: c-type cytochrome, partial [Saprospiraceae bacterium]|nr:c-type cytochrome [Saprospiraceae bacterium]